MNQDNGFQKLDDFAESNLAWAKQTFPRSTAIGVFNHAISEIEELIECLEQDPRKGERDSIGIQFTPGNCVEEAADILILILQGFKRLDLDIEFVYEQAVIKMEVNKRRKWGKQNENGFTEHEK